VATRLQDAGKAIIANRIIGSGTEPKYAAMGTGTGQGASATTLATEVDSRSGANGGSRVTTTVTNDTYQVINTTTAGASRTITEAGLFDASSAGNIFTYSDGFTFTLANGDSIQWTWKVAFS
jgi:hypothetical protein